MAIDAIGGTSGRGTPYGFGFGSTGELQDQFMKIMLTQLRFQDPMEPIKEQEFLAQMAQFSSATQIGELNRTVQATLQYLMAAKAGESLLSAVNLIGKTFVAEVRDGLVEGVVESVCYHGGSLMVKSGEDLVPVESLVYVGSAPEPEPELEEPAPLEPAAAETVENTGLEG